MKKGCGGGTFFKKFLPRKIIIILFPPSSERAAAHDVAAGDTAKSADDVSELRDVVNAEQPFVDRLPEIEQRDEDKCQRELAVADIFDGRQENAHEDDAACAEQRRVSRDKAVNGSADNSGEYDRNEKIKTPVSALHGRTDYEQKAHIPEEVSKISVPEHMADEPHISHR